MDNANVWAYLAGLFDGEGSILINRMPLRGKVQRRHYYLCVTLRNTNTEAVYFMSSHTGGKVQIIKGRNGCQDNAYLPIYSQQAKRTLENMLPFLIIKKEQAIHALEFQKRLESYAPTVKRMRRGKKGHPCVEDSEMEWREYMAVELKQIRERAKNYNLCVGRN